MINADSSADSPPIKLSESNARSHPTFEYLTQASAGVHGPRAPDPLAAMAQSSAPSKDALVEAEALIAHLHANAETEKLFLTQELHDDLGGLLVSAIMDLSSARTRLPPMDPRLQAQFERIRKTLESAIDHSRRMAEELRPSILDNFGLFAALQWQLKRASRESNAICTEAYPDVEPQFQSAALTALFRIAQDALAMTFKRESVKSADLNVRVEDGAVWMKFSDDGVPVMLDGKETGAANAIASMRHRIRVLGGTVDMNRTADGGTVLTAWMPMTPKAET
jgi:signal transduction histidine kinase